MHVIRIILAIAILAMLLRRNLSAEQPLSSARDLSNSLLADSSAITGQTFTITGQVTYVRDIPHDDLRVLVVADKSGAVALTSTSENPTFRNLQPGTTAVFNGTVRLNAHKKRFADCSQCDIFALGNPVRPTDSKISDLLDGKHDFKLTMVNGVLRDVTFSETSSGWIMAVICKERESLFISVPDSEKCMKRLQGLVGEDVVATGVCVPLDQSARLRIGRTFKVASGNDIQPVKSSDGKLKRAPDIRTIKCTRASEIISLGQHSAVGCVIASWQKRYALIKTDDETLVNIKLSNDCTPRHGERIFVVGLPETDLFRISLVNARWTSMGHPPLVHEKSVHISPKNIVSLSNGKEIIQSSYHGKTISITGIVRSVSKAETGMIHIESDGRLVPIDVSALNGISTDISVGCKVKVDGTCIIEYAELHHAAAFPTLKGFFIVARTPLDLVVLERPSWWTFERLVATVAALIACLLGILAWNFVLRRLVVRKGRELMHEQLEHVSAELKTEERTRLAVELHDSLAQNLTGVSLEIDTAAKVLDECPASTKTHLTVAARSLKSCRDELRNCLWDLRNRALEEGTMDNAIRQTLAPHVAGIDVAIRFSVPREAISDNTAHAILRIIRELTLNAIRHGAATKIRIAGSIEGDHMLFSVRDNGNGFDPEHAPGFSEGHYGLLGIQERVDEFEGEFTLTSSPGKGTRATVSLKVPKGS